MRDNLIHHTKNRKKNRPGDHRVIPESEQQDLDPQSAPN
jgi:hypothetical protein